MGSRSSKTPYNNYNDQNNIHVHHDLQNQMQPPVPMPLHHQRPCKCPQSRPREFSPSRDHRRQRKPRVLINSIDTDVDVIRRSKSFSFDESNRYYDDDISFEEIPRRRPRKSNWDDIEIETLEAKHSDWSDEKDQIDIEKQREKSFKEEISESYVENFNQLDYGPDKTKNKQFKKTVVFKDNSFLPHYVESIQDVYNRNFQATSNGKKVLPQYLKKNVTFLNNEPVHIPPFPMIKSKPVTLFEIDEFMQRNPRCKIVYE